MSTQIQDVYRVLFVHRVYDGDTWWLRVDQRFRDWKLIECRLRGYDTPEMRSSSTRRVSAYEKAKAVEAADLVGAWLAENVTLAPVGTSVYLRTDPDPEKYGRWLADPWVESDGDQWPERHLGAELRAHGLATVYDPGKPEGQRGARWFEEYAEEIAAAEAAFLAGAPL